MFIATTTTFESSWAALKQAVADGSIREVLHSKDKIPVTLKNGEKTAVVATYDETGKLFFVFDNCLRDPYYMNPRFTNGGAWAGSKMREYTAIRWMNRAGLKSILHKWRRGCASSGSI